MKTFRRSAVAMAAALMLSGCAHFENVLSVSLPGQGEPRAFVNSTYMGFSLGTELRASDAQSLAEMVRLRNYAEIARAQALAAQQRAGGGN